MTCFKPGDLAVYPNYGVGKIESIEQKSLGADHVPCYVVSMVGSGARVFVPVDSANKMGLRTVTEINDAKEIYRHFKARNVELLKMNWNKRYRFLQERMKSGTVKDVANVISDLYFLKRKKGLSYGEEKLLAEAEEIISTELSIAENVTKDLVKKRIYKIVTKPRKHV